MEIIEAAANPADEGPVTLVDPVQEARNQGQQSEANTQAGGTEESIEALTKEALGEADPASPLEEIEIEWDGIKAKVPAPLKDAFLRHQDYTHKTMDLSEKRKAFEAEQSAFRQLASRTDADFTGFVNLAVLNTEIQRIASIDTTGWTQDEVQGALAQLSALQTQKQQLGLALTQRAQHASALERQQIEQARQQAVKEAAARIPNFTEERRQALETFATDMGVPPDAVQELSAPWEYEVLHYADIGRKFVERQRKAATMKAAHAGTPATMLGGASSGGRDPASMSMDEYATWRAAGNG